MDWTSFGIGVGVAALFYNAYVLFMLFVIRRTPKRTFMRIMNTIYNSTQTFEDPTDEFKKILDEEKK
jgi:hypothetical protein